MHLQQLKGMQCSRYLEAGVPFVNKGKKGVPFLSNMTAANIILIIIIVLQFLSNDCYFRIYSLVLKIGNKNH